MPKNDGVMMEGVRLLPGKYRNFRGEATQYNAQGDRSFAVILPPDVAQQMERDGWNVKQTKPREGDDGEQIGQEYFLKVQVSYKNKPPRIIMLTSRGRTVISEELVEMLDYADIEKADLIVNPYHYDIGGRKGISAYLKSMYLTIEEDELDLKYGVSPTGKPAEEEDDV